MRLPTPRKLPSGSYHIQLRLNGRSVSITAATEKECTRKATLIKAQHIAGVEEQIATKNTLGGVVDEYISEVSPVLSPSTVRGYKQIRANYFKGFFDKLPHKVNFQQMINTEYKLHSAKTVRNAWGLVRSSLGHVGYPVPNVRLPAVPVKEIPFLQPEEIPKFIKAVEGDIAEIPILLELQGLRRSEAKGLDWKDVDLVNGTIRIHSARVQNSDGKFVTKSTTKNRSSSRTIPILIPQLKLALSACSDKQGSVVKVAENTMLTHTKAACERAGVTVVGNHGLRHSFASLGYHLGLNERQMMELGGWADYTTMHRIYVRISESSKDKSREKMLTFFESANATAHGA